MPASALAEVVAYTLQGLLERLKGKLFWIIILMILLIILVIAYLS